MSGKVHYRLIPIQPHTRLIGTYRMEWDKASPWRMDLPSLISEVLGPTQLSIGEELDKLSKGTANRCKIFGFDGELAGYEVTPITPETCPYLQLVAIITRTLKKCKQCGCYHSHADQCPPAWKVGQP